MVSNYPASIAVFDRDYEIRDAANTARESWTPRERAPWRNLPCGYCGVNHNPLLTECK